MGSLLPLGVVYVALYGAFGSQSPFLPAWLAERGAGPEGIGAILAAATAAKIAAGPALGYLADRRAARRGLLALCGAAAGLASFAFLAAHEFGPLLLVALVHALAVAALAPVLDALGVTAAAREGFAYGWLRGAGSAAFVVAAAGTGQLVGASGLAAMLAASGTLFLAMAPAAARLPDLPGQARPFDRAEAVRVISEPRFLRLVLVAALVLGSHSVNDAFAVIRWGAAGLGPGMASLLWATAVVAEVVVFLALGPPLLARLGPARAVALAALAGAARWALMATTTEVPLLVLAQSAHGLTFALLHLAAMRLIAELVPDEAAATAQTLYGTFGLGLASAALTLAAGFLFARLGAGSYWAMALLCLAALPLAPGLASRPAQR